MKELLPWRGIHPAISACLLKFKTKYLCVKFVAADEEAFEDNAEEYIRRDMEGSDVDTRRRAACDLVRALCKSFEGPVIQNFSQYVQNMLADYAKNPAQNWKNKDAAVFLVTSLASKGSTQKVNDNFIQKSIGWGEAMSNVNT